MFNNAIFVPHLSCALQASTRVLRINGETIYLGYPDGSVGTVGSFTMPKGLHVGGIGGLINLSGNIFVSYGLTDNTVKIWDFGMPIQAPQLVQFPGVSNIRHIAKISAQGFGVLAELADKKFGFTIFDLNHKNFTGEHYFQPLGDITCFDTYSDEEIIFGFSYFKPEVGAYYSKACFYNIKNQKVISALRSDGVISYIKIFPRWIFTGYTDGKIRIWDPKDGRCISMLTTDKKPIHYLDILHINQTIFLISASDGGKLQYWRHQASPIQPAEIPLGLRSPLMSPSAPPAFAPEFVPLADLSESKESAAALPRPPSPQAQSYLSPLGRVLQKASDFIFND